MSAGQLLNREACIDEAFSSLGYLQTSVKPIVRRMMDECDTGRHPTEITRCHRREGEQLSKQEKGAAGIRANAFMSRVAFSELTDIGRTRAVVAHEETLLRALGSYSRAKKLAGRLTAGCELRYSGMAGTECRACARLTDLRVDTSGAFIFPPSDCDQPACGLGIVTHFDVELYRRIRSTD